jgi:hypothetical protein
MSLFQFSILTSILLTTVGMLSWVKQPRVCSAMLAFARSNRIAVFFMTTSLGWFLVCYVQNLSEADFGNYKLIIGLVAVFIYFGSFALVKDFLAVRSLSIICLFYSREVLDSAWLQDSPGRLLLVTITYVIIVAALYFGAWPFRFRDLFIWLDKNDYLVKLIAISFSAVGLILLAVSFTL